MFEQSLTKYSNSTVGEFIEHFSAPRQPKPGQSADMPLMRRAVADHVRQCITRDVALMERFETPLSSLQIVALATTMDKLAKPYTELVGPERNAAVAERVEIMRQLLRYMRTIQ